MNVRIGACPSSFIFKTRPCFKKSLTSSRLPLPPRVRRTRGAAALGDAVADAEKRRRRGRDDEQRPDSHDCYFKKSVMDVAGVVPAFSALATNWDTAVAPVTLKCAISLLDANSVEALTVA